ncbi:Membrane protein YdfJ [Leuconostoc suionicum]|uniref:Membrane protein YdfJ n=1 Tax=Leuconostoc suionicum TaxID=1511761 RepID=A0A2N9KH10_9LACO|nr:MMPL family transporter [Leuconostoc suionicum]SPD95080.1 Membrane protein YdfJ [Leuconostoc suionicum]SPE09880.1 Membrane protein YdfJ [Leuconostoc suionicum]SPH05683.1 Membrane protein YdfJ [Leuconostoc suionicum]
MQRLLTKFGKWVYNHKCKVLILWFSLLIIFLVTLMSLGSHFNEDLKISGLPSTNIQTVLKKEFNQSVDAGTMNIVIQNNNDKSINTEYNKNLINKTITEIATKNKNSINKITNPYESGTISSDNSTAIISITFNKNSNTVPKNIVNGIQKTANSNLKNKNLKVAYSGSVMQSYSTGSLSEIIGVFLAFILLVILFKSFVTAGLPIVTAFIGLISGLMVVMIGTNYFSIASVAQTLSIMISLAVGIDYALFIIHRYISELKNNEKRGENKSANVMSNAEIMGITLSSAGTSVLFAGVTVIIALVGLSFVGIDFLTQMGFAAAIGVVFAVLTAITLLPALISLLHKYIKPIRINKIAKKKPSGWFTRTIINHPIIVSIFSVVVLLSFMIPANHMRLGMPFDGALPKSTTQRQAYDMMADKFGDGYNATLIGVVKLKNSNTSEENKKVLEQITNHVKNMNNVKMLVPVANQEVIEKYNSATMQEKIKSEGQQYIQSKILEYMKKNPTATGAEQQKIANEYKSQYESRIKQDIQTEALSGIPAQISKNKKYAMFVVIPKTNSTSPETENLAKKINKYANKLQKNDVANITLTGTNAVNIDITEKLNNAIPLFMTIVMILAFLLLMFMFKSFIIPLVAIIGFGLSLIASLGLTTLIMQDGVFNISQGAPILAFLPVIVIGIVFGLAMDYEVFMVSRIRENFIKTGDTTQAVQVGLQESGPVIITAALIMIAVFGSFALVSNPTIKAIGISLASGVLFDAFLVRLIIIPATIKIFGKANWYFPRMMRFK